MYVCWHIIIVPDPQVLLFPQEQEKGLHKTTTNNPDQASELEHLQNQSGFEIWYSHQPLQYKTATSYLTSIKSN